MLDAGEQASRPLMLHEYEGPDEGVYELLGFLPVNENPLQMTPMHLLMDAHKLINNLYRKLNEDAKARKTILSVMQGMEEEAKRAISAGNLEVLVTENPDFIRDLQLVGIDSQMLAYAIHMSDRANFLANNLETTLGLGPAAGTLGQEQMIAGRVSAMIADWAEQTTTATERVMRRIADYVWKDNLRTYEVEVPIPGLPGQNLRRKFGPRQRVGEPPEHAVKIEPHTLRHLTPEERAQRVIQLTGSVLAPLLPLAMQQGTSLDVRKFVSLVANLANVPEVADAWIAVDPGMAAQQQLHKPAGGPRVYEHHQIPASTRATRDSNMVQNLIGAGTQGG